MNMSVREDTAKQWPRAEEHRLLSAILHDSNDAITVQDFNGTIRFWNLGAQRIYGYTRTEALKMNICQIVPDYRLDETWAFIKRLREGEEARSFETQRITKDGRLIDV